MRWTAKKSVAKVASETRREIPHMHTNWRTSKRTTYKMKPFFQYKAKLAMASILLASIVQAQDRASTGAAPGAATIASSPADTAVTGKDPQQPALLAKAGEEPQAAAALPSAAPVAAPDPPPATALSTPAITGPLFGLPP